MHHDQAEEEDNGASGELSTIYFYYVIYEAVLINLVGFFTLFFQCELQELAGYLHEKFPSMSELALESLTGHYWLKDDLNCSTPSAHCLTCA